MKRSFSKVLIFSIVLNVLLIVVASVLMLNKLGLLTRESVGMTEYSYLNNPQYEANLSMFRLVEGDADVVFAGDSITAFGRFSEFFPNTTVMNRGIGSDTTEGLYNRMDEILSHHPKKIFIMIGINDLARNVTKVESLKYYEMIISKVREELPDCEIYVQSILPTMSDNLNNISQRNDALIKMCDEFQVEYINLYDLFLIDGKTNNTLLSADGVHLNGNGYRIWLDSVKDLVCSE